MRSRYLSMLLRVRVVHCSQLKSFLVKGHLPCSASTACMQNPPLAEAAPWLTICVGHTHHDCEHSLQDASQCIILQTNTTLHDYILYVMQYHKYSGFSPGSVDQCILENLHLRCNLSVNIVCWVSTWACLHGPVTQTANEFLPFDQKDIAPKQYPSIMLYKTHNYLA